MTFNFDTPPDRRGTDSQKWQKYRRPRHPADVGRRHGFRVGARRSSRPSSGARRTASSGIPGRLSRPSTRWSGPRGPLRVEGRPLVDRLAPGARAAASTSPSGPSPSPATRSSASRPIYPPFTIAPKGQGRIARSVPLALDTEAKRWEIDWDALEARRDAADQGAPLLPSPQPGRPGLDPRRARAGRRVLRAGTTSCSAPTRSTATSSSKPRRRARADRRRGPGQSRADGDVHGAEQDVQRPGPRRLVRHHPGCRAARAVCQGDRRDRRRGQCLRLRRLRGGLPRRASPGARR